MVQGTIDHIVGATLTKTSAKAYIGHFQDSDFSGNGAQNVANAGSGAGFSSNDSGIERLCEIFRNMSDKSLDGQLFSSDITGMDWIGALGEQFFWQPMP